VLTVRVTRDEATTDWERRSYVAPCWRCGARAVGLGVRTFADDDLDRCLTRDLASVARAAAEALLLWTYQSKQPELDDVLYACAVVHGTDYEETRDCAYQIVSDKETAK
jgi:hypothetical protein